MFDAPATPPDLDVLDPAAVKALVASLYAEIEHLKLVVAKLRRMHFGRKSEKLDRHSRTTRTPVGRTPSRGSTADAARREVEAESRAAGPA